MKVSKLVVRDFRGFKQLDLQLDPHVTVLVGTNGSGKTSLLDAISLMLSHIATGVRDREIPTPNELSANDVRLGASTALVELTAEIEGVEATWKIAKTLPGHPLGAQSDVSQLRAPLDAVERVLGSLAARIPLAVYFPTNRAALDIPARIKTPHEFDALSAYDGALDGGTSNFRGFFEWFRQEEDVYNERLSRQQSLPLDDASLPGDQTAASPLPIVRAAIEGLFPGATELRIERRPQRMTLLLNGTRLDVVQLSDGEKILLAMAGDLARRMVLAATTADNPLDHPAVVLIDEIELHLHPGAQRLMIPRLTNVFRNTQFIVTTHSPQVLSSVRSDKVRLITGFELRELERATWHRDTNRILEAAFGDPGRPDEVARKLNQLRDAVEQDRHADARALIRELHEVTEGVDPDVFYLEQLLPPEDGEEAPR